MKGSSAKNFSLAGIFIILLALGGLMLTGFLTYLAWNGQNPWPSSTYGHSGRMIRPPTIPLPKHLHVAPAILYGHAPIPQANRQMIKL
ncbi:MAG TPA: hypothetical protein VFU27_15925 [Terriglobales bacterium]|nr:hypothetical protein [Terriglobales bacterium]